MIDADTIREIVATYQKHGWILRRVLLSATLKQHLGKRMDALFDPVSVIDADIDAAWFSRPPKSGGVAWEIRHLGEFPVAMLENADEDDLGFESSLKNIESRLGEAIAAKQTA